MQFARGNDYRRAELAIQYILLYTIQSRHDIGGLSKCIDVDPKTIESPTIIYHAVRDKQLVAHLFL